MNNKEIARQFNLLGKLLELHGENPFKTRSYSSAYVTIRKLPYPVIDRTKEELLQVKGIGKAISEKIVELKETGEIGALSNYIQNTPPGIVEMLQIKGFGPKKIKVVWKELEIDTPGELLYACEENRLIDLKGFGLKSQDNIKQQLEYYLDSRGKYLYGHIETEAHDLIQLLRADLGESNIEFINGIRRMYPVVDGIELLTDAQQDLLKSLLDNLPEYETEGDTMTYRGIKVSVTYVSKTSYQESLFKHSASDEFLEAWSDKFGFDSMDDKEYFSSHNLAYIPSELRESPDMIDLAQSVEDLDLIDLTDIKGVVHAHSTYSDGTATVREMAQACIDLGYQYLVMSDHSKAAFYANGLKEDRVLAQMEEIDRLNAEYESFKIFKSIECDILYDGSLDYDDDFLVHFDCVITSVHSNLKMTQDKAMERLLGAIRHPATTILGHPTGRLLLSREGYPIDHQELIDACAEHNVSIEINASPYRLDLDWSWIPYAQERGVMLSINPDAHSTAGIKDIRYGVLAARKGGLKSQNCLNAKNCSQFSEWISKHRPC